MNELIYEKGEAPGPKREKIKWGGGHVFELQLNYIQNRASLARTKLNDFLVAGGGCLKAVSLPPTSDFEDVMAELFNVINILQLLKPLVETVP